MSKLARLTIPRFLLGALLTAMCLAAVARVGDGCTAGEVRLKAPTPPGPAITGREPVLELNEAVPLFKTPVPAIIGYRSPAGEGDTSLALAAEAPAPAPRGHDALLPRPPPG